MRNTKTLQYLNNEILNIKTYSTVCSNTQIHRQKSKNFSYLYENTTKWTEQ